MNCRNAFCFLFVLYLTSSISAAVGGFQTKAEDDGLALTNQALSIIDSCFQIFPSVEKGDFLMVESATSNTLDVAREDEPTLIHNVNVYHRFIFDHASQKYYYARNYLKKDIHASTDTPPKITEDVTEQISGICFDKHERYLRLMPIAAWTNTDNQKPNGYYFAQHGVPDIRNAGWGSLDSGRLWLDPEAFKSQVVSLTTFAKKIENNSDGTITITFEFQPKSRSEEVWMQRTTMKFDSENFVILETTSGAYQPDNPLAKNLMMSRRKVRWNEIDGISVPIEITDRVPKAVKIGDRKEGILETTSYKIHWFSLNKDLDDAWFDPAILNDETKVIRSSDPKHTQANSVIPDNDQ